MKKNRDLNRLFIIEGKKLVLEVAKQMPSIIKDLFFTDTFLHECNSNIIEIPPKNCNVITVEELKKISLQSTPNNVLAVCSYFEIAANKNSKLSLYLDEIKDPGNFGTIIRTADWFGISTVYCSSNCCEMFNPKVLQSTMGAFLRVNVKYIELPNLLAKTKFSEIYGAYLKGESIYTHTFNENSLLVVGNEANGIRDDFKHLITKPITIPAKQNVGSESLNAAIATGIIISELTKNFSA
ncbi:MAG: RNA methyltransferase [Bacteroidetes bacterium]|nr:RNA methyltransferase [Bacteroidota bacterium]